MDWLTAGPPMSEDGHEQQQELHSRACVRNPSRDSSTRTPDSDVDAEEQIQLGMNDCKQEICTQTAAESGYLESGLEKRTKASVHGSGKSSWMPSLRSQQQETSEQTDRAAAKKPMKSQEVATKRVGSWMPTLRPPVPNPEAAAMKRR